MILDHAHLDPAQRIQVSRVVDRFRDRAIGRERCLREIMALGYEGGSVRRYVDLVESTFEKPVRPKPVSLRPWTEIAAYYRRGALKN